MMDEEHEKLDKADKADRAAKAAKAAKAKPKAAPTLVKQKDKKKTHLLD